MLHSLTIPPGINVCELIVEATECARVCVEVDSKDPAIDDFFGFFFLTTLQTLEIRRFI